MIAPLVRLAGRDERILVGPETADDAGVYRLGSHALVATTDFITPVCDDPRRFGRVARAPQKLPGRGGRLIFPQSLETFPEISLPSATEAHRARESPCFSQSPETLPKISFPDAAEAYPARESPYFGDPRPGMNSRAKTGHRTVPMRPDDINCASQWILLDSRRILLASRGTVLASRRILRGSWRNRQGPADPTGLSSPPTASSGSERGAAPRSLAPPPAPRRSSGRGGRR